MVEAFGETYRTIDVRAAVVRKVEGWVNALTVVRVTYEEPEAARKRLHQLEQVHGIVQTDDFRIVMSARPFPEWREFCGEVGSGLLRLENLEIRLHQPLALDDQGNYLRADSAVM